MTKKVFAHLIKEVITPGFCLGCGACVASCPFSVLAMDGEKPKLVGRCELCEVCYYQCPQLADQSELEMRAFGRGAGEGETFGISKRAVSVQALGQEIRARCQDGGAVTALLAELVEANFIDGAIVAASNNWRPVPKVAISRAELIECAGTKYSRGPALLGLRDAVDLYALRRVALVGLPCQIKALRRMQFNDLVVHRVIDNVKLCVGLFCMEAFPYEALFKKVVEGKLDIKLGEVTKFDVKRGRFLIYSKGKLVRKLDVDALKQFMDVPCRLCSDFAAELADISVGAVGSPLGRSTVILRTPMGDEAFELAEARRAFDVSPVEEVRPGMALVEKLSASKRRRAENEVKRRRKFGGPLPPRPSERPATAQPGPSP